MKNLLTLTTVIDGAGYPSFSYGCSQRKCPIQSLSSSDWGQCVDPRGLFREAASPCECRGQASKMRLFIHFHRFRLPSWTISLNLKKLPLFAVHLVVLFWWKRIPLAFFFFFFWKHLYLFKKSTVRYNLHPITYIYIRWTVEWVLMKVSIHVTTMTIKTHSTSITLRSPPDSAFEFPGHPAPSPRQFLICFLALCIRFLLF